MTVSTKLQPNNAGQVGAEYKGAIDATTHVHDRIGGAFACHQNDQGSPDAPDLTVLVDAGALTRAGLVPLEVAVQSTAALTAPSGNPRKDVVYIDNTTGAVGVATGAEAGSPADPVVPAGKTAVARINWTVGMTEITNADIDDLRVGGSAPEFTGPDVSGSPQLDGTAGLVTRPLVANAGQFLRTDGWAEVSDQIARDMAASALALADANGTAGPVGAFYLADPFTADTLAVKTNSTYDAASDRYSNEPVFTMIARTDGSNIGNMTAASQLGNAFDGNTNQAATSCAYTPSTGQGTVGKDYGSGVTHTVRQAIVYSSNNLGFNFSSGGTNSTTITVDYSDNGSAWTTAATDTFNNANSLLTRTIAVPNVGAHRYWRITVVDSTGAGSNYCIGEAQFYTLNAVANMILRPTPATLLTANPDDIMGYFLFDPVDSVTFGTDIIGKVSIADGSPEDFVTGDWTQVGTFGSFELWRLDVDMTGKTGSSLEYSIETGNNKEIRLKQSVGCVALY